MLLILSLGQSREHVVFHFETVLLSVDLIDDLVIFEVDLESEVVLFLGAIGKAPIIHVSGEVLSSYLI